jgi:anthranilate phosphoribosyltransferase
LLRSKGETAVEISGMVKAMKKVCLPVSCSGQLLDIVGTGGDGADTINISKIMQLLESVSTCIIQNAITETQITHAKSTFLNLKLFH